MATPGLMQEAAFYGIGKIKTIGVSMRRYTKTDCFKRQVKRWFHRHYKGYSDLLAIISFIAGILFMTWGVMMLLCEEYRAVIDVSLAFVLFVGASDLWQYGRRKT